jgi:hypothetical protein
VLDGVKAGTLGEHPPREDALHIAGQRHFVDLDEGGGVGRLGRRSGVADSRRDLERAEFHGLIQGNLEMRDAPGHLVEGREHGDRVLDDLGLGLAHGKADHQSESHQQ